jgi:hypothetical protein
VRRRQRGVDDLKDKLLVLAAGQQAGEAAVGVYVGQQNALSGSAIRAASATASHERSVPSTPTTSGVVWWVTRLRMLPSAGPRMYGAAAASRRRAHPHPTSQDGSIGRLKCTLEPMAHGYSRGEHES